MRARSVFIVALPLILIAGAIVLMLFVALSGVTHDKLWTVQIDVSHLTIDPKNIIVQQGLNISNAGVNTITARDLSLSDIYEVNVWGYCYASAKGERHCTKAKFDWASSFNEEYLGGSDLPGAVKIKLPDDVKDSITLFRSIARNAQAVLIVSLLALAAAFLVGILSGFTRKWTGITILAWFTAVVVCAAAGLVSAMAVIVMQGVEKSGQNYGVKSTSGTIFLSINWISFVISVAAAIFWLASRCIDHPKQQKLGKAAPCGFEGYELVSADRNNGRSEVRGGGV